MRNSLVLQPSHNTYRDLLEYFRQEKPLPPVLVNYLNWNYRNLDSRNFRSLLRYYQIPTAAKPYAFELHDEKLDSHVLKQLKKRLEIAAEETPSGVEMRLTPEQFAQLRAIAAVTNEIIFWHDSPYSPHLMGPRMFHGSIPHLVYIQWGDLLGVIKFEGVHRETEVPGNILIYFVSRRYRDTLQNLEEYRRRLTPQPSLQNIPPAQNLVETPQTSLYTTPRPILMPTPINAGMEGT